MESLIINKIREELKVPKKQYNSFSNYYYRSCEDILEAAKPLLFKYNCNLKISDSIENIGDRYYIKSQVEVMHNDIRMAFSEAYAREALNKKGMDESQITGACSSYARKYALNAIFLLDDTKDADTMDNKDIDNKPNKLSTPPLKQDLSKPDIPNHNTTKNDQITYISEKIMEMTNNNYNDAADMLETLSQFTVNDKDTGEKKTIKGFRGFRALVEKASDARVKVIYGVTKKEYENYLKNGIQDDVKKELNPAEAQRNKKFNEYANKKEA